LNNNGNLPRVKMLFFPHERWAIVSGLACRKKTAPNMIRLPTTKTPIGNGKHRVGRDRGNHSVQVFQRKLLLVHCVVSTNRKRVEACYYNAETIYTEYTKH
jgi:hypothetical protein